MRSVSYLIIALLFMCFAAASLAFLALKPRPAKLTAPNLSHHFGIVPQNETLEASFFLKNESESEIRIHRVDADCSCAVATLNEKKIAPGKSKELKVTLETGGRRGQTRKSVVVSFSSESEKRLRILPLQLLANITPDYEVSPQEVKFDRKVTDSAIVIVTPTCNFEEFEIEDVYSHHRAVGVEIEKASHKTEAKRIVVRFDPTLWPADSAGSTEVVVKTNNQREPQFYLDVSIF